MKVKILETFSGIHGAFKKGDTVELSNDILVPYIDCGYAEEVVEEETKEIPTVEFSPTNKKTKMTKLKSLTWEKE